MPVISITRLRVRSLYYLPLFALRTLRIAFQAKRADGNLATSLLRDRHHVYWTATSWSSEAQIKAFMLASPHGPTMRKLLEWCDEAALVHWTQAAAELPSWPEAHRRLLQEGRKSKVNHPTEAHLAHALPEPDASPTRALRLR
jgi:hypothetical protein